MEQPNKKGEEQSYKTKYTLINVMPANIYAVVPKRGASVPWMPFAILSVAPRRGINFDVNSTV